MHGLILTSFRRYADEALPPAARALWRDRPAYDPAAAYEDAEFDALVEGACRLTGRTRREILVEFGGFAAERVFAELYPDYFAASGTTRALLLSVEERIHEVVRATIPGAYPPRLHVRPLGADSAIVSYTSERRLCDLLEGLVLGTARHFGELLTVEHVQCMQRGDVGCVVLVEPAT